jgi:hypothetical protein
MLGKAVKFRHCPATVSAPAEAFVLAMQETSQRYFAMTSESFENHWRAFPGR